ncbi:MAG: GNAT family N-acetyltransferase [Bacillota bacterium]
MSAYEEDKLVGIGRIISDGVFQAIICDLIVLTEYQGRGIGSKILKKLLYQCETNEILMVQLFAAKDKNTYYKKFGFEDRPDDAPGMRWQYRNIF